MMQELGTEASAETVARHFADFIDGFVLDPADANLESAVRAAGINCHTTPSVMKSLDDRVHLAQETFEFAASLR
jgi:LPPG:FO 2-phospho-L-lactate transferase